MHPSGVIVLDYDGYIAYMETCDPNGFLTTPEHVIGMHVEEAGAATGAKDTNSMDAFIKTRRHKVQTSFEYEINGIRRCGILLPRRTFITQIFHIVL